MNFENDWDLAKSGKARLYNQDQSFERNFLKIGEHLEFSDTWTFASSLDLNDYNLDIKFEATFMNVLKDTNLIEFNEFDCVWDIVDKTVIDDEFRDRTEFENCFDDYSYGLLYDAFSKPNVEFVNSEMFENHFKDIVKSAELQKECEVRSTKSKNGKNSLKSLLEARIKRLKYMEEHMKTCKDSVSSKVTYVCKTCGLQSRWQRKLFFSHIMPEHIKGSKKTKKKKIKRMKKKQIRIESKVKRIYICENLDCNKTFSNIENRKRHILSIHRENLRFKCSFCNKEFRDRFDRERHVRIKHNKLASYRCPLCSFKTKFKRSLIRHEKIKHEALPFDKNGKIVCDICKQTFIKQFSMRRHMTKHEAIKIGYECVFCSNVKLENHVCSFLCPNCNRSFNSKVGLGSHLKIHAKLDNIDKCLTRIGDHDDLQNQIKSLMY